MSFSRELKDFVEGFKTGEDIKKGWTERKYREAQIENERGPTEEEKNKPGYFSGASSGAPGGGIPVGKGYYDAVEASDADMGHARHAISDIESGGRYDATGIVIPKTGDRAYGKYQIMGANIPSWTKRYLGKEMTPDEFLKDPAAQDRVFDGEFKRLAGLYGWGGAAQAWLGGEGSVGKQDRKDPLGTSVGKYGQMFMANFEKYRQQGGGTAVAGGTPAAVPATQTASSGALPEPGTTTAVGGGPSTTKAAPGQELSTATANAAQPGNEKQKGQDTGSFIDPETANKMDPKMRRVVERAARDNPNLFGFNPLTKTLRTPEEQQDMVKKGWSKTMKSKHLVGKAVDLVPINPQTGQPDPNYKQGYGAVHNAMMKAAQDEGVTDLDWGGNWKSFKDLPHYEVSQLQPQPEDQTQFGGQSTMFTAQGGVIPEPQYFQDGGIPVPDLKPDPNQNNPSAGTGYVDRYNATRNYTQKIQPSAAPAFQARRVGQAMPGVTYPGAMQMVNGMTPSQLAYKNQLDALAAQRAAKPAPAAAPAPAPVAPKPQPMKNNAFWMDPYGAGRGQMNPWTGIANPTWSHREQGGMVYSNFADGGVIPDGGPAIQQAPPPSSAGDPYDSEYWTPKQQGAGYQEGGYIDPYAGTDIPSPESVRQLYDPYAGALPEEYLGSREDFERQRQGDPYYRPPDVSLEPAQRYPTVAQDQNYIYRDRRPPDRRHELPEEYRGSREEFERQSQGDRAYRPPEPPPRQRYPTVAQDQNYTYRDRPPPGRDVRRELPEEYRGSREQFERQSQGDRAYRPPPPPPRTVYPTVAQDQNYDYRNAEQGPPRDVRGVLPEDYASSRMSFELQSQGDRAYRPPPPPPAQRYPTVAQDQNYTYQNELPPPRPPTTDDSAYDYENQPMDRRSSRFEGTDPRSAPVTTPSQPRFVYPTVAQDQGAPPPVAPSVEQPHRPYSPTPVNQPHRPYSPTPPSAALNMVPPLDRGTPYQNTMPEPKLDTTRTGSTKKAEPKRETKAEPKREAPRKTAPPPARHPPSYYNDPYEREAESMFATRDAQGRPLARRHFAEGGAIPDPYENEGSMFARPAPQAAPQAAPAARPAPPPAGVDRTQTGSIPPDSSSPGQTLGQPSSHRPTPRLLSDVSVALHHGVQFLQHAFGMDQQGGAVPTPEGQQGQADGARRFASGEGAATPQEVNAIDDKIDPGRQMPEGDRQMQRLANVVQFYLERGQKDKASAAAAGLMQYGAQRTQQYGSLAAAAYRKYQQTKDPQDLQKVTQILQGAYSMIPNGGDYGVTINPETHMLEVQHTDDQGKVTTDQVSPDQLPDIIKGVQDKSSYWGQIQLLADPEGVHQREREKIQSAEWTRQHGITQGEELAKEGRTKEEWTRQHELANQEEIAKEERANKQKIAEAEAAAKAKQAEHEQALREELEKEKRAKVESDRQALRNAAIDKLKQENKDIDFEGGVNPALADLHDATEADDKDLINEKASRVWDSLPNTKDRPKMFADLTGLTSNDFKYLPKTAAAMVATGDAPPANYPGQKPGDVVKKGYAKDGKPAWVVTQGDKQFLIPAS